MHEDLHITSAQNPRLKEALRLWDRRERDEKSLFLIEGYRELLRAVDSNQLINQLFICPELFLGENEEALINRIRSAGAQILNCTPPLFKKLSYRDRPDGLVAIAPILNRTLKDFQEIISPNALFVVAEAIEKPGNLGTILRSSDAVKVDGLIVCDRCTDIHNPNVVRASVGTLFTVPVAEASSSETIQWLKNNKIAILAATPYAKNAYTNIDMTGSIAIAVGTEQLGLSDQWMQHADIQVRIPMLGVADSLNVAMATTLLLYEAIRQRYK